MYLTLSSNPLTGLLGLSNYSMKIVILQRSFSVNWGNDSKRSQVIQIPLKKKPKTFCEKLSLRFQEGFHNLDLLWRAFQASACRCPLEHERLTLGEYNKRATFILMRALYTQTNTPFSNFKFGPSFELLNEIFSIFGVFSSVYTS